MAEESPSPSEETPEDKATEVAPPSLDEVLSWLARSKAAAVLALLREPDFAMVSVKSFSGFQQNAKGYGNSLVRKRLAHEATQHAKFAERLRALAEENSTPPPPPIMGESERNPAPPLLGAGGSSAKLDSVRAERDLRRRERDEERQARRSAEESAAQANRDRAAAQAERDDWQKQAEQQAQKIARLERRIAKMQAEQTSLLRALPSPTAAPLRERAQTPEAEPLLLSAALSPWEEAVRRVLNKGRPDAARALAEDVLRVDAQEPSALEILSLAQEALGDSRLAAQTARLLFSVQAKRATARGTTDALLRLCALSQPIKDVEMRQWLGFLRADNIESLAYARAALSRLRGQSPERFDPLAAQIHAISEAWANLLMPPPGALGPEEETPILWQGRPLTGRQMIAAVATGEVALVESAARGLARLDAPTQERVLAALQQAAGEDDSALEPLTRRPEARRGAAMVDGSNAAWFGQELLSSPRPRLGPILALRRALRRKGFFPIILYGDAPLPYTIDERDTLRAMLAEREIRLVNTGVDADEELLREARRLEAPLVTNDRMEDWDPDGEVEKIRFDIAPGGTVHLLFGH